MLTDREKKLAWIAGGIAVAALLFRGASSGQWLPKPRGRQGVKDTYGDFSYTEGDGGDIHPDPAWSQNNITDVELHTGQTVRFHTLVAAELRQLYQAACEAGGWTPKGRPQTYVPRHINHDASKPLSFHSWGIALDLDPTDNPRQGQGTVELHPAFIKVFEDAGWTWGGRWKGASRDPMHFEALKE